MTILSVCDQYQEKLSNSKTKDQRDQRQDKLRSSWQPPGPDEETNMTILGVCQPIWPISTKTIEAAKPTTKETHVNANFEAAIAT